MSFHIHSLIAGDLGKTYNSLSTLKHSIELGSEAILFVGDLSYADRYKYHDVGVRWDSWGRLAERSAAYRPWLSLAGNHEIEYFPYMVRNSILTFVSTLIHVLSL